MFVYKGEYYNKNYGEVYIIQDISIELTNYFHSKTSFKKNCFSVWASTLNMGLINKVDMVCLSPVEYGV